MASKLGWQLTAVGRGRMEGGGGGKQKLTIFLQQRLQSKAKSSRPQTPKFFSFLLPPPGELRQAPYYRPVSQ